MGTNVLSNAKHFHCSCHAIWLPCKTSITETWLRVDMVDQSAVNCLCPTGYNFYHLPRTKCRGGGVAVLYRKRFSLKKLSTGISFKSFEFIDCMMNYSSSGLRLVVVYRLPPSQENKLNVTLFEDEFATFLQLLAGTNGRSC